MMQGKQQEHVASSWRAQEPLAAATSHTSSMSVGYAVFPRQERKLWIRSDPVRRQKELRLSSVPKGLLKTWYRTKAM